MGQSISLILGSCLSACVNASTYLHDKGNDWRYGDEDYEFWSAEMPTVVTAAAATTDLHVAVLKNSTEDVVKILRSNPDAARQLNCSGETPLHAACRLGYLHVIKAILEVVYIPDVKSEAGSPLHSTLQSVKAGYTSTNNGILVIKALVSRGCHLDWTDRNGRTAAFLAAEHGSVDCLKTLSDLGADLNLREHNFFSPLYMATIRGDLSCVHALLSQGERVAVDGCDSMSRTPLMASLITILNNLRYEKMPNDCFWSTDEDSLHDMASARQNKIAIVESLLHSGANANAVDYQERTPLTLAFLILELDHIRTSVFANFNVSSPVDQHQTVSDLHSKAIQTCDEESSYCILVRLLILHGGTVPTDWVKDYSKAPVWLQDIYDKAKSCQRQTRHLCSLSHISRYVVRHHLALLYRLHRVQELPLPNSMLSYVSVKYL